LIKEEKKLSIFCVGERKEKNIPAKRDKLQSVWNLKKIKIKFQVQTHSN
jgi:hypothetical protein